MHADFKIEICLGHGGDAVGHVVAAGATGEWKATGDRERPGIVLGDPQLDWMDSCAVENHPMINSLWAQRRAIIQVSLPLAGAKRNAIYRACRAAETASARLRSFRSKT